jgi:hypothetical protein
LNGDGQGAPKPLPSIGNLMGFLDAFKAMGTGFRLIPKAQELHGPS